MTDVVQFISVDLCRPSPTARPVQPIRVEILARSIAEVGLRQPINVRPILDGYEIRGGGHRHAAFVSLGRETIPAFVRTDDDLHAELAEIDENYVRNELSPAERAIAIDRRKAIYEALHPETKAGVAGGKARQGSASDKLSFAESTAEATGKNKRTVERDAHRGGQVGADQLRDVVGTSLDKGEELDALAKLPEDKRAQIIDRAKAGEKVSAKTEAKKDKRETREADLGAKQIALPDKKFGVILADPEWRFEPYSRETGMNRAADNHYPTSTTDVIASRPVASIAADDCALFLWATAPMLPDALAVMKAWGFEYKSHVVWLKDRQGTGYWFRNQHELLLVGTRGEIPAPAMGTQFRSALAYDVGEHSVKPPFAHEIVEAYYPTLPKIELNARRRREGWEAWGLEAPEEITSNASVPAASVAETASEEILDEETHEEPQDGASFVARYTKVIKETPRLNFRRVEPDEELEDIPDAMRRVTLTPAERVLTSRIDLTDLDRNERAKIVHLQSDPGAATFVTRSLLLAVAERQGLMTEDAG